MPTSVLMAKYYTQCYFSIRLLVLFLHQPLHSLKPQIFWVYLFFFIILLLVRIDCHLKLWKCVFLGYTWSKRVTISTPLACEAIWSRLTWPSLSLDLSLKFFKTWVYSLCQTLYRFLLLPPSTLHSDAPIQVNPTRPLQAYHCWQLSPLAAEPPPTTLVDSLTTSLPALALMPTLDLPTVLKKGIRPTCNPSLHYVNLSYHPLSPKHFRCLPCILKTACATLSHPW